MVGCAHPGRDSDDANVSHLPRLQPYNVRHVPARKPQQVEFEESSFGIEPSDQSSASASSYAALAAKPAAWTPGETVSDNGVAVSHRSAPAAPASCFPENLAPVLPGLAIWQIER